MFNDFLISLIKSTVYNSIHRHTSVFTNIKWTVQRMHVLWCSTVYFIVLWGTNACQVLRMCLYIQSVCVYACVCVCVCVLFYACVHWKESVCLLCLTVTAEKSNYKLLDIGVCVCVCVCACYMYNLYIDSPVITNIYNGPTLMTTRFLLHPVSQRRAKAFISLSLALFRSLLSSSSSSSSLLFSCLKP